MPNNLKAVAKPRANKFDNYDPRDFNALGQRLLDAMKSAGYRSPRDFAIAALGSESKGGNLSSQLTRLVADKPEACLMADQLALYAKAARVSLFWLITGEGAKTQGPYGSLTGEEMQGIPDELVRATRALMELDNVSARLAADLAERALTQHPAGWLPPDKWLQRMRILLDDTGHESGMRPSVRVQAATPTNDS